MPPRPSGSVPSPSPRRPPGEERVFSAPDGRLWGASVRSGPGGPDSSVLVFTCMGEARRAVRALAVGAGVRLRDLSDDVLREHLASAPAVADLA